MLLNIFHCLRRMRTSARTPGYAVDFGFTCSVREIRVDDDWRNTSGTMTDGGRRRSCVYESLICVCLDSTALDTKELYICS